MPLMFLLPLIHCGDPLLRWILSWKKLFLLEYLPSCWPNVEERETVETCYRKGLVCVLTATLAAGVNLPARRVIFRQPCIGRDFIDGTRYKQMAGRAGQTGRTGIDTKGESVLICKPEEVKKILGLLNDSYPPLYSCLSEDRNGMTYAILEVVAGGIVQTANDIHGYVRCTLLNSTKPFEEVVRSAQDSLRWLCHKKFLEWSDETKLYTTTPLGRVSFGSSLCPEESLIVLDDLVRAREGFVLASDLHMVYLVTPINVDVEPDWELYYERFMQLYILSRPACWQSSWSTRTVPDAHGSWCSSSHITEIKAYHKSLGLDFVDNSYLMFSAVHVRIAIDMFVVAWILSPNEERSSYPNLQKEVKKRLSSDAAASANRSGRWKDQTRRAAHNGCCLRAAQTRALFSVSLEENSSFSRKKLIG